MNRFYYLLIKLFRNNEFRHGHFFRKFAHRKLLKKMGKSIKIGPAVFITEPENISLGSNISINQFSVISGYGGLEIGNDVSIAHGCSIMTTSHPFDNPDEIIRKGKLLTGKVKIGNNVWIGAGVRILMGVEIGDGTVIGAGSVVNKSLPSNSVCAGVPARVIKSRFQE